MLRNVDVFVKPRHDLRTKSTTGGLITLVAASVAGLLFLGQLYTQLMGTTYHSLSLSESTAIPMLGSYDPFLSRVYDIKGKIPLKIHITFPHVECHMLDLKLNHAPLTAKDFDFKTSRGRNRVEKFKPTTIDLREAGFNKSHKGGCTIRNTLRVPLVAGTLSIHLTQAAWQRAISTLMMYAQIFETDKEKASTLNVNQYNMTHFIHLVQFGKRFPLAKNDPLKKVYHKIENKMSGVALENIKIQLIPTIYNGFLTSQKTYQHSVVSHTVQPESMVNQGAALLPGLVMSYDVTPLAVRHEIGRDNIFVFLSSLVSIVGGAFVTVGLFTGCLVHSAKTVAKKVD
jgi:hypothetical protein